MFTGIIETTGKITKIEDKHYFTISAKDFLSDIKIGESIAVNGVCTTVIGLDGDNFKIEIMPETFRVTNFNFLQVGDEVNLEKSLKVNGRLDGHFVLGHVDGVGIVKEIKTVGDYIELVISAPEALRIYLARKGTVAVDGVSLTIAEDMGDFFRVALISHTLEITNLKHAKAGTAVNLEIDVIARYLEKLMSERYAK